MPLHTAPVTRSSSISTTLVMLKVRRANQDALPTEVGRVVG